MITLEHPIDYATTAIHMAMGFFAPDDHTLNFYSGDMEKLNGVIGASSHVASFADRLYFGFQAVLNRWGNEEACPGVFEYSVAEPAGKRLRGYVQAGSLSRPDREEMALMIAEFVMDGPRSREGDKRPFTKEQVYEVALGGMKGR
jgi:hypothetical protein